MRINILGCFVFFVVASPLAFGISMERKKKESMERIIRVCLDVPDLTFPRPELNDDWKLKSFHRSKGIVKEELEALKKISSNPEQSSFSYRGRTFGQHLQSCKKKMDKIQREHDESLSKKPNKEALAKLNSALWSCDIATRWLGEPEKLGDRGRNISIHYDGYLVGIDRALKLDPKVAYWKEAKIKACNEVIVPRSLALKNEQKTKVALKIERKKKEESLRLAQAKANHDAKTRKAQSLGYKGFYGGITSLLDELGHGQTTIEDVRPYLFLPDVHDRFYVDSIVGESVIYGFKRNSSEYLRIAVKKEAGKYYGDGAELADVYYSVVGFEEFVTVLGHTKQVVIFSAVSSN